MAKMTYGIDVSGDRCTISCANNCGFVYEEHAELKREYPLISE